MLRRVPAAELKSTLANFVTFARSLKGDETASRESAFHNAGATSQVAPERNDNSEAQIFLDQFFRALDHASAIEAGAL